MDAAFARSDREAAEEKARGSNGGERLSRTGMPVCETKHVERFQIKDNPQVSVSDRYMLAVGQAAEVTGLG